MIKQLAFLTSLSISSVALAGSDPCKGVKIETSDFGGSRWSAKGYYDMTLFELAKGADSDTLVLKLPAQTKALTTVVIPAGASAEVAFEDGTVWRETTTTGSPGVVMTTRGGTFWYFTISIDAAKLKQLAASPVKNARLLVGDQGYGDAWFIASAAPSLQRAAACYASK